MAVDPGTGFALKQAGSALVKTVLTSIGKGLAEFQERKGQRAVAALGSALADLEGLPPDGADEALARLLTTAEPGVHDPHEVLYETFRVFAFTRTEAAWPYIARMTAEYLSRSRAIDDLFRRSGWLLERCEQEDLSMLVEAVTYSRDVLADPDPEVVGVVWHGPDYGDVLGVDYQHRPFGLAVNAAAKVGLDAMPPARIVAGEFRGAEVLRLIQDARFGRQTNHERVFISRKHVANLAGVFTWRRVV
jgi:hypothetical protein